ncbi:RNA polymerase recycling motor HelD [Lactobacillus delbrueckii subsp. allosunkii]|uniref:RNA polymerase recycling motor HelD n=1 Tax=Lactobacillus delbrueckii TaxID=1584 RepID=UPI003A8C7283
MVENSDRKAEQAHLDQVLQKIDQKRDKLQQAIAKDKAEARNISAHFYDDIRLDYDDYSTSMDTALSIQQQQQMLKERDNAWQVNARELATLKRLHVHPYFARVDFEEAGEEPESIYIGLASFMDENNELLIYDWRAPISSIYYDGKIGKVTYYSPEGPVEVDMSKKRQFMIEDGTIINMFDTDETIGDQMLMEVLSEKSSIQMKSIVKTIQKEQNKIIRDTTSDLLFVQGAAGSGKTSAILQRIAFLLYRYRGNLKSGNVIMFSPNQLFNDYIENVLPEMGEQNMVQMTYWQFIARRLPKMKVQNPFDQFEDRQADTAIGRFKDSLAFYKLATRYGQHLNQSGMIFRNIYFRTKKKPFFSKEEIKELYYSFNENYKLGNRIDATREELIRRLNKRVASEARKVWVSREIEGLSHEQMLDMYDRPDQEFSSEKAERAFLGKKIVIKHLAKVARRINHNGFLNLRGQYLAFLRAVPKMTDLAKYGISEEEWLAHVEEVKAKFKEQEIDLRDASAYLYLYDQIIARQTNLEMRYCFIDEIQDYSAFQLAYLRYNFPRAKFTMLGDLNQAIFTKDESSSLLKQISGLFDPEKTKLVQLTKSYRSTKQLTDYTKQILRHGEKIESFNRQGPLPQVWGRSDEAEALAALKAALAENDAQKLTTAIITKDLEAAKKLADQLEGVHLISSANQRLVEGNLVLPSYLAKGLEFDAVIMWDASKAAYHEEDETQLVYTIASRAMYKLDLVYAGEKSPLLPTNEATFVKK